MFKKRFYFTIIILLLTARANSQDVEHLWGNFTNHFKQKPLKVTGGFSMSHILYNIIGSEPHRQPYTYFFNANINFSVFGWNIPFSASYSNQEFNYQTLKLMPFNRFGLSPYYKWIKVHIGYRSMSFSPYTINGKTFLGGGVELTPGIFSFAVMYGKFQNAVEIDTANTKPAYKRMGYAFKAGLQKGSDFANIIVFYAQDDSASLPVYSRISDVKPMQNLIFNINANKNLLKQLSLGINLATSALTRDLYSDEMNTAHKNFFSFAGFMSEKISTVYGNAIKFGLTYSEKLYSLGLNYERTSPEYMTLGAYYFNNDFENLTVNTTLKLLENKLNLALNIGRQKNNLEGNKLSENKRLVGAGSLSFSPSEKWNVSLNYSNFRAYTYIRSQLDDFDNNDPYANLDTMNFTQITQNASTNMFFILGNPKNKNQRKTLTLNFSYQKADKQQQDFNQNAGSSFYNGNLSFMYNLVPLSLSVISGFNTNYTTACNKNTLLIGPSFSVGKAFLKKTMKTMFTTAYNNSYANGETSSKILTFRLNSTYVIKKKHNFGLNMIFINRFGINSLNVKSFKEFTGTFTYSFSF